MPEAENHLLTGATNDTWRAWLMTGAQRAPADRRRIRGANQGLKRMLIEGMRDREERPRGWRDFSGAMVRHAVDEAMRALPEEDTQVVKLAYFGGYSNREIADQVGLTETTVQRRLRRALSAISDHIHRGRAVGRRAAFALLAWLSGRWIEESTRHLAQAATVAAATVVIVAQPAPLPITSHAAVAPHAAVSAQPDAVAAPAVSDRPHADAVHAVPVVPPIPSPTPLGVPSIEPPAVQLPVRPPVLPPLPVNVKPPQLSRP